MSVEEVFNQFQQLGLHSRQEGIELGRVPLAYAFIAKIEQRDTSSSAKERPESSQRTQKKKGGAC